MEGLPIATFFWWWVASAAQGDDCVTSALLQPLVLGDESSTFKHVSRWFYIMDNCESYVICKTIVELKHWHVPCGIIYNLSLRLLIHGSHIKLEPWKLAEMVHLCRVEPVLVFSLRLCPIRGDARFYFYVWEMFEWI